MKKITWKLEQRKLEELLSYEFNPRNITEKGKAELKKSIDKFGLAEPIVINLDNVIIGGHARYFIMLEKGEVVCDCYVPSFLLTPKEVKELNIRLNKNIAGEWDFDILANSFELPDLLSWGFEEKELDLDLWDDKTEEQLDDVPEPQKEAISKTGDLFLLDGRHRVLCGDSTKKKDVALLMDGKKADMVFTDPPYGVYDDWENSLRDRKNTNSASIYNDKIENYYLFTKNWLLNIPFENYNTVYVWINGKNINDILNVAKESNFKLDIFIIWVKNTFVFSRLDYKPQHEICIYGWKGKHKFYGNGKTNIINYNKPSKSELHPTMKPVQMCVDLISDGSKKTDVVIDSFLGSGSTLIACEQTNRICYGMEIDPIYIDVILRRYHTLYPDKEIKCLTNPKFNFKKLFNDRKEEK